MILDILEKRENEEERNEQESVLDKDEKESNCPDYSDKG